VNFSRRLEQLENHVKAWCGTADPPAEEPTPRPVSLQEIREERARLGASAGLTRQERLAWQCYWHTAAQLIRPPEIEAEQALIRAADLTRDEFKLLTTAPEERPPEAQAQADQVMSKWQGAWASLDDGTRALLEKKWKKENGFVAEIGKWTTDIDASDGPAAFSAAVSKVAAVLETLDDEEKRRLHLHDLWDLWSLGRA